jgi:Glycopeptide antibiotics resistance protein
VYGAICLGLTVFFGLFLLDTAVAIRWCDGVNHSTGFNPAAEIHRFLYEGVARWTEMLANVAVFVPFGFFLSEFLSTTKHFSDRRQIGRFALAAFGLSLCIESLQLIFRLGVFEITDLVLNTLGGFVGALMSAGVRKVVGERCHWH